LPSCSPFCESAYRFTVAVPPRPTSMLFHAEMLKVEATSCSTNCVLDVTDPETPLIVSVKLPNTAVLAAVRAMATPLFELTGLVANDAVTPLGNPDTYRLTLLVKPYAGET
jgi:hypothetical protein